MTAALEARMAREAKRVRTDAQALADVRTLDEWAARHPGLAFLTQDFGIAATGNLAEDDHSERWACVAPSSLALRFLGPTSDAARHAAAEWVRASLAGNPGLGITNDTRQQSVAARLSA